MPNLLDTCGLYNIFNGVYHVFNHRTVNEVANGLAGTGKTLGIVATGSGNDLVKSVNVPTRMDEAVTTLTQGHVRHIDIGTISCSAGRGSTSGVRQLPGPYVC